MRFWGTALRPLPHTPGIFSVSTLLEILEVHRNRHRGHYYRQHVSTLLEILADEIVERLIRRYNIPRFQPFLRF